MKINAFLLFLLLLKGQIYGAASVTQTVTFSISAINEISVSGNPGPLNITTAVAGGNPTPAVDSTTTYNITTNVTGQSITGALNTAMPANTALSIALTPPTGATSAGPVVLSTTPQVLVSGIPATAQSGLAIAYAFSATITASPIAATTRIVTLTIGP